MPPAILRDSRAYLLLESVIHALQVQVEQGFQYVLLSLMFCLTLTTGSLSRPDHFANELTDLSSALLTTTTRHWSRLRRRASRSKSIEASCPSASRFSTHRTQNGRPTSFRPKWLTPSTNKSKMNYISTAAHVKNDGRGVKDLDLEVGSTNNHIDRAISYTAAILAVDAQRYKFLVENDLHTFRIL